MRLARFAEERQGHAYDAIVGQREGRAMPEGVTTVPHRKRRSVQAECEELKLVEEAQRHWRRYLDLDPMGEWAAIAREHFGGVMR